MATTYPACAPHTTKTRYSRQTTTSQVCDFEQERIQVSQRSFAQQHDLPRTTFQYWLKRKALLRQEDEAATAFFESEEGLEWLHRLTVAAQLVITQLCGGSIEHLEQFFRLSGLALFVAASVGTQHGAVTAMEEAICAFGQAERERLAAHMPQRQLTLCEDETFHPAICLVALDLSSGFILVERYAERRDAVTWNEAVRTGLLGLRVEVVQCVSDQARALIAHAQSGLGVHHAPDLFHVQHEIVKATSLPLAGLVQRAQDALAEAQSELGQVCEQKAQCEQNTNPQESSTVSTLGEQFAQAQQKVAAAQRHQDEMLQAQQDTHTAMQGLSLAYHPVDLQTGHLKTPAQVKCTLEQHFETIETIAQQTELSDACQERIAKAKRLLPHLIATVAFFYQILAQRVVDLKLEKDVVSVFLAQLLPGYYLEKVAQQQRLAPERETLLVQAAKLLSPWHARAGPAGSLSEEKRHLLEETAREYAQLFARSSSCTEGRNAHLRQKHQSAHRMSPGKLGAATVLHNYFLQRDDGSSAAERFFGQKPQNLFDYLLATLPMPRRPAARRKQASA